MKRLLLVIYLLAITAPVLAQPAEIGALRAKINAQMQNNGYEQDTSYINNISRLAYLYHSLDADSLFDYARTALELSKKINYQKGIAENLRQVGNGYMFTGNFNQALVYYERSLTLAKKLNDKQLVCMAESNIGLNYKNIGKFGDALDYTLQAYELAQQLGNSMKIASELDNLGEIFFARKEYEKAIGYATMALQKSVEMRDDYYTAYLNNSLGKMLFKTGKYPQALQYYTKAQDYYSKTNDPLGITSTSLLIAKVYLQYKNYTQAFTYAFKGLQIAEARKDKRDVADAEQTLADIYEAKGDYKTALRYLKQTKSHNDSLFNDETQKRLFELQAEYKYQQMEDDLKSAEAKKDLQNKHALQNKRQQIIIAVLVILALAVISILLYRSRAEKLKINQVLLEKTVEISWQKEEIEKQAVQLRVSNGQKDKLFSIIAHDLRSPFISLQNLLALFGDGALPTEQVKEFVDKLNVDVRQTAGLVTNLLYWAQSQMNGMAAKPVCFSLTGLVEDTMASMQKPAADKGVILHANLPGELAVLADKDMIQLVVRNLLSNAIKFCSRHDTITISLKEVGDNAEVCIADTGVGITDDILQKINNGESITTYGTSKEKGTGLGLLLCKDFIARNGGLLRIESGPGRGSRFCFTLKKAEQPVAI